MCKISAVFMRSPGKRTREAFRPRIIHPRGVQWRGDQSSSVKSALIPRRIFSRFLVFPFFLPPHPRAVHGWSTVTLTWRSAENVLTLTNTSSVSGTYLCVYLCVWARAPSPLKNKIFRSCRGPLFLSLSLSRGVPPMPTTCKLDGMKLFLYPPRSLSLSLLGDVIDVGYHSAKHFGKECARRSVMER